MKIIVPIKQTLDPSGLTFRRDKERMFVNRKEYVIEPGSRAAIEAALRLKDADSQHQVIAISMGQPRVDDALREALAMGCDEAYLLSDRAFENADTAVTVRVLATAIQKLGEADLVVAGSRSGDTAAGQVGARLAGALGYSQITDAYALTVAGDGLAATRRWGDGFATVGTCLPAVITVVRDAFAPRYANGARIISAYREWQVPVWGASDLALDESAFDPLVTLRAESFPAPFEVGEVFRGEPDTVADEIIAVLRAQKLIGQAGGYHGL